MTKTILFTITILLGLCFFGSEAKLTQSQDIQLFYNIFKDWTSKFNKQFGIEEMAVRFMNWKSNYDLVQDFNAQDLDLKLEMNDFADMSPEEFSALHLGFNPTLKAKNPSLLGNLNDNSTLGGDDDEFSNETLLNASRYGLPKSVDWRKKNAVAQVRNQGQCGGCWSFAAAGALEGLYAIKKNKLTQLSVQQMIDCSAEYGNMGCDGGLMTYAYSYTLRNGIQPETSYQYTASVNQCNHNANKVLFKNKGYKEVPQNDYLNLKAAVAKQPVSVGIEASSTTVQLFKSGVISTGCSTNLDHAVLVVGYDTAKNGQEYWIVKNSWGPSWGLNGFFNIAMGSQNNGAGVCGINMMASYPTL